jgi:hypothetical protein
VGNAGDFAPLLGEVARNNPNCPGSGLPTPKPGPSHGFFRSRSIHHATKQGCSLARPAYGSTGGEVGTSRRADCSGGAASCSLWEPRPQDNFPAPGTLGAFCAAYGSRPISQCIAHHRFCLGLSLRTMAVGRCAQSSRDVGDGPLTMTPWRRHLVGSGAVTIRKGREGCFGFQSRGADAGPAAGIGRRNVPAVVRCPPQLPGDTIAGADAPRGVRHGA